MIDIDLPSNIEEMTTDELIEFYDRDSFGNVPPAITRLKLVTMMMDKLGLILNRELLTFLVAEPEVILSVSTAGSGKTTGAHAKIIAEKMYRKINGGKLYGSRILYLIYNRNNVESVKVQHKMYVDRVNSGPLKKLGIDENLSVATIHSKFRMLLAEPSVQHITGFNNMTQMTTEQSDSYMRMSMKVIAKKHNIEISEFLLSDFKNLYNLSVETLTPYRECVGSQYFDRIKQPIEIIVSVFEKYDSLKQSRKFFDYTDILSMMYNHLKTNEHFREAIYSWIDYIIVDEVQDIAPIMLESIKLMKKETAPLVFIGDEDQNIYSFRGSSVSTILKLKDMFENTKIYPLSINRRCGENIVNLAKYILEENTLRFNKPIKPHKSGGNIEFIPYNSRDGQLGNLLNKVNKLDINELKKTCICYRNRETSYYLSDMLFDNDIPFSVLSGYEAYSNPLIKNLINVFSAFLTPYRTDSKMEIFKILPDMKKSKWKEIVNANITKSIEDFEFESSETDLEIFDIVRNIILTVETAPLGIYFDYIYKCFKLAYWDRYAKTRKFLKEDLRYFEQKTFQFFDKSKRWLDIYNDYRKKVNTSLENKKNGFGLKISTFHSLKGLEFDRVFILDLDELIFPNFELIESYKYGEREELELKESENRLFYVACTRAKTDLTFYHSEKNPSRYINMLKTKIQENKNKERLDITSQDVEYSEDLLNNILSKKLELRGETRIESKLKKLDLLNNIKKEVIEVKEEKNDIDLFSDYEDEEDVQESIAISVTDDDRKSKLETTIIEDEPFDLFGDDEVEETEIKEEIKIKEDSIIETEPKVEFREAKDFLSSVLDSL